MLTSWLTDGWSPLTFWRALLAGAVGVRASEGSAPALLPAGDFACGLPVVLEMYNNRIRKGLDSFPVLQLSLGIDWDCGKMHRRWVKGVQGESFKGKENVVASRRDNFWVKTVVFWRVLEGFERQNAFKFERLQWQLGDVKVFHGTRKNTLDVLSCFPSGNEQQSNKEMGVCFYRHEGYYTVSIGVVPWQLYARIGKECNGSCNNMSQ